jgi:hypothetical protein
MCNIYTSITQYLTELSIYPDLSNPDFKNNNPNKKSANNPNDNNPYINANDNNPKIPVNLGYFVGNYFNCLKVHNYVSYWALPCNFYIFTCNLQSFTLQFRLGKVRSGQVRLG